jgi:uncharacterized glyoxalase superfamily protein PhnB
LRPFFKKLLHSAQQSDVTETVKFFTDYLGFEIVALYVEQIELLFQEFKKKNVTFNYELTKQPWGMNEMQIDDPYLNAIRFGENSGL